MAGGGGAIYNAGSLTITGSTFSGNTATGPGADGGALMSNGAVNISNSTFFGNSAVTDGSGGTGGAFRLDGAAGTSTVRQITISNNANDATYGAIDITNTSANVSFSILANSITALDCTKRGTGTITSSNNLIENGATCSPAITLDPGLGPLQDNNGPTRTMAITTTSPAYNFTAPCPLNVDQRGVVRPQPVGGNCDLGAYELDDTPPTVAMSSSLGDPTRKTIIPVTVQFSEAVSGFTISDIVAGNATVSNFVAVDGDTYTFNLVPTSHGLVTADIAAGVASDPAGNNNTAATQFSRTFVAAGASPALAPLLPASGFPQGKMISLPRQPAEQAYLSTNLWLEIPKLGARMSIVGVPLTEKNWNISWLGGEAGWLSGSAFPTWNGNSVLTAHVWDAFNRPGPFANLKDLRYGDQVRVHAYGGIYIYEIRDNLTVLPANVSSVFKHEEKSWLTLVTCEDYQERSQTYSFRRMVRAVLVGVMAEN